MRKFASRIPFEKKSSIEPVSSEEYTPQVTESLRQLTAYVNAWVHRFPRNGTTTEL